ncbi:hypothetical protein Tco_1354151 [Tanacetum coccineum]
MMRTFWAISGLLERMVGKYLAEVGVVPEPPAGDKASKPKSTSSHLPKPKLAPTKPSKSVPEKKRKLVKETLDEPSPAKRSKAGLVGKGASLKVPSSHLKNKSPTNQYIFQRRTPMTTGPSRSAESPSLNADLALADSEMESDEIMTSVSKEKDASNKELTESNAGVQDEGQVGSNPGKQDEGQAGSNPGNVVVFHPQPSHVVHYGPNLEPMDLAVSDASTQQNPEHLDEDSTETLSSLHNLEKDISFTDQFFKEKLQEEEPEKPNTESEVQSMVTVPIHQDTSLVPLMTTLVINLTTLQSDSPTIHAPLPKSTGTTTTITTTTTLPPPPPLPKQSTTDLILLQCIGELEQHMANLIQDKLALEERLDKHGSCLYNLENLKISQKVSKAVNEIVTDAVDRAMQALLRTRFSDLPAVDMKEILQQRMFEDKSYEAHDDHKNLFIALQKSLEHDYSNQLLADLDEARKKKRKKRDLPRTPSGSPLPQPPPPPPPAGASGAPDSLMNDDSSPDKQASALVSTYATPVENSLLAKSGDMMTFMNWYCRKVNKTVLTQAYFEGQAYEVVKAFYPDVIHLQFLMEECHKMLTD